MAATKAADAIKALTKWIAELDRLAQSGDEALAEDAALAAEEATLKMSPYRSDVKSSVVVDPDGELLDNDELLARYRPPGR